MPSFILRMAASEPRLHDTWSFVTLTIDCSERFITLEFGGVLDFFPSILVICRFPSNRSRDDRSAHDWSKKDPADCIAGSLQMNFGGRAISSSGWLAACLP